MLSNLRVLGEHSLIGVINVLTDVCAHGDGTLRHRSCELVRLSMSLCRWTHKSLFRPVRRTQTTGFEIVVFWDVVSCSLLSRSLHPGGTCCLSLSDSTLVVAVGRPACWHIPEDLDVNNAMRNSNNTI